SLKVLEGHSGPVWNIEFSPDGAIVASGSWDSTIRLWDIKSGSSKVLKGHNSYVTSVAFSQDGMTVTSADYTGVRKLWNVESGQEITISSEFNQLENQENTNMLIDKDGWILRNGNKILWLPMSLHGGAVSEYKSFIAIGTVQGR
ncbi:hypothetical protein HK096_004110, partial [Nowakowskiella sp. JEL0078]